MQQLSLQFNDIHNTTSIPSCIFNLKSLTKLELSGLGLNGIISTGFCELTKLQILSIVNTNIEGDIPDCFRELTNLLVFTVQNNMKLTQEL